MTHTLGEGGMIVASFLKRHCQVGIDVKETHQTKHEISMLQLKFQKSSQTFDGLHSTS
jgi:phosphopantetheinyl transferase